MNLLAPYDDCENPICLAGEGGRKADGALRPRMAWPALYLLMDGEALPQEKPDVPVKPRTSSIVPCITLPVFPHVIRMAFLPFPGIVEDPAAEAD